MLLLLAFAQALPPLRSADTPHIMKRTGPPRRVVSPPPSRTTMTEEEEEEDQIFPLDELLDRSSRVTFIRRVYGLLSTSLGLTAIACIACAANPRAISSLLLDPLGQIFLGVCAAVGVAAPLALLAPSLRHDPAISIPIFAAFSFAEAAVLGVACTAFKLQTIVRALAQTAAATLGLTVYAYQPNPNLDLTPFGSVLFASLLVLTVAGILGAVLRIPWMATAYSAFGAVLFSLFIVHDTEKIVGGTHRRHTHLDTRDYVLGAITLYLDIANLFLFLLRLSAAASGAGGGDDDNHHHHF
ncbi:hypothetical protein CTAYLR_000345 [Chrysophaeum taylorii]|uniref:Uncharacterized protein n=1 Tax=Chrysophaeum taylorii TaxID=2483200 RepID=A0AAD7XLV7_9STRA|nr:hypothetical protein CTAYLR_000345 [Chrysophaeum taylorii]